MSAPFAVVSQEKHQEHKDSNSKDASECDDGDHVSTAHESVCGSITVAVDCRVGCGAGRR